ncbi:MAG: hypothetical protein WCL00_10310 [Bacteroidota bacterium]
MKKSFTILIFSIFIVTCTLSAQDHESGGAKRPDHIKSGFYIKLGPCFPVGDFSKGQSLLIHNPLFSHPSDSVTLTYLPAKIGPAMDLGFLIYLGPSFANNYVRVGIDATFLSIWFTTTNPVLSQEAKYEHQYYFGGQKFGPIITVNPIDKLLIDISYKINANFGYHYDEWKDTTYNSGYPHYLTGGLSNAQYSKFGINLLGQEFSMNIRYSIMLFGFQYNMGTMTFDNFDSARTKEKIRIDTYRVMIGFKF